MSDSNSISNNRSALKSFLGSVASVKGDLSNITAPPFLLAEHSTVEVPQYWANHPNLFVAPALAKTPEERALRVLKWFLGSLKNQQYAGRKPADGVKKPLNAFLGELFIGSFKDDEAGETKVIAEQVGHHPPVTACYFRNEKHGISGQGFTCQEITFSTNVSIKQKGYAIQHIDEYDEDHLVPVPDVRIKGILGGTLYPELNGNYSIVSTSGYCSDIKFGGKGYLGGGTKNGVEARVYNEKNPSQSIYTLDGSWVDSYIIKDSKGKTIETYIVDAERSVPLSIEDEAEQDPWESRRAWKGVREAIKKNDMKATGDAKSLIEEGQRQLRNQEQARGQKWQPVFFRQQKEESAMQKLIAMAKHNFGIDQAGGIWRVDKEAVVNARKPYHGDLVPSGRSTGAGRKGNEGNNVEGNTAAGNNQAPPSQEAGKASAVLGDNTEEKENFERHQIEEMLRNKYSTSGR